MEDEGITQELVKKLFEYRDDGNLIRMVAVRGGKSRVGDVAGTTQSKGYLQVTINYKRYLIHRLIYLYHYGYFPEHQVDHIDRDKLNNRIENLRHVTSQCNLRNTGNPKDNTSGVKGVIWANHANKWMTYIMLWGKQYHLGYHDTFDEAVCHRLAAEQALNWDGCDSTSPAYLHVKSVTQD